MKQTAVEWYEKEINSLFEKYEAKEISYVDFHIMKHNLFYPAKQMEKEQIEDAIIKGEENIDMDGCYENPNLSDQYYKETYE